jgi:hypothetical protein
MGYPMVFTKKKDRRIRFCDDYLRLNHVTKLDEPPSHGLVTLLISSQEPDTSLTLDLVSEYWQVAMDPASQEKTAFTT